LHRSNKILETINKATQPEKIFFVMNLKHQNEFSK